MIERASRDSRFADHPGLAVHGIESYIAVPLHRADGAFFGTLCALDPDPSELPEDKLEIFELLARLIAYQLEEEDLREERERFLAVLGHDLRNPLQAVVNSAELLRALPDLPPVATAAGNRIARSARRMDRMVSDLLDFARGRFGDGIHIERRPLDLEELVRGLVDELTVAAEAPVVRIEITGDTRAEADPGRLGQLLSNLLSNAIHHGGGRPVTVRVQGGDPPVDPPDRPGRVTIAVHNAGEPIPPELLPRLFHPFQRKAGGAGLGLGLFIAAEVARAHDGTLDVRSGRDEGTTLTLTLPRSSPADPG